MSTDPEYGKYLEKRAEELGLPTDPEAYKDGGLVVAATARNLAEAEALAAALKGCDIPAWVDAPMAATGSTDYIPPMICVMVPAGRLSDAETLLAAAAPDKRTTSGVSAGTMRQAHLALRGAGLTVLGTFLTLAGVTALFSGAFYEDVTLFGLALGALGAGLILATMGVQRLVRSGKANE